MRFIVLPNGQRVPRDAEDVCFLLTNNCDDWFRFSTLYVLIYCDFLGEQVQMPGRSQFRLTVCQTRLRNGSRRLSF